MGEDFLQHAVSLTIIVYDLIRCIDVAHSHASNTLKNYSSHYNHLNRFASALGLNVMSFFPHSKPKDDVVDGMDYFCAWYHVDLSMSGGRKNEDGLRLGRAFSSIRGHRSALFYLFDSQALESPTDSHMFTAFMGGLRARLGDTSTPAWAITLEVMLAMQAHFESEYGRLLPMALPGLQLWEDLWSTAFSAAWVVVSFCAATRGNELFRVLVQHFLDKAYSCLGDAVEIRRVGHDYFCIPHAWDKTHDSTPCIVPIAAVTASGLKPKQWILRCLDLHKRVGNVSGPFWRHTHNGKRWTSGFALNAVLRPAIMRHAGVDPPLVPAFVTDTSITSNSLRRGGNTRMGDVYVPRPLRDFLCRWRLPKGRQPVMQDRYDDPPLERALQATLPL